jgi:hypothetical protein
VLRDISIDHGRWAVLTVQELIDPENLPDQWINTFAANPGEIVV